MAARPRPLSTRTWRVIAAGPLGLLLWAAAVAAASAQPAAALHTVARQTLPPHHAAGLRLADGTPRLPPPPHSTTGRTLDVTQFGADPADSDVDDRPAIEAALAAAQPGDEVYLPSGIYNLRTPSSQHLHVHILLRSRVNLRGQSTESVVLRSSFDTGTGKSPYTVIRGQDISDVLVSSLTVSSTWNRRFPTDPRVQNPDRGGPMYAVVLEGQTGVNQRVTFDAVHVERYMRMGFRIGKGSSDVVIRRSVARDATDIGGGGAGYGFVLQGAGHAPAEANPFLGTRGDNHFNLIEDCVAQGPYLRHGALIQYWAHNNLVRHSRFDRVVYDAIDLHGEDEYLNEIAHNTIVGTSAGAGIGLGNSGATHDKSGPGNWIHHNTIVGAMRGITLEYGTRDTVIEDNLIQGNHVHADQAGIGIGSAQGVLVRRNRIVDNTAAGFAAIAFHANRAMGQEPAGSPASVRVEDNVISGNTGERAQAVRITAQGAGNAFVGNRVSGNTDDQLPP